MAATGLWRLDENVALDLNIVNDVGAVDLTLVGATGTDVVHRADGPGGMITSSMLFDGTTQYATNLSNFGWAAGAAGSVSFWIKVASGTDNVQFCGRTNGASFAARLDAGTIRFRTSANYDFAIPGGSIPNDTWCFVMFTKTDSAGGNLLRMFFGAVGGSVVESSTGALECAELFNPTRIGNGQTALIFHDGYIAWVRGFNSDESANVATWFAEGAASSSVSITSYVANQIVQRRQTDGAADLTVEGEYVGSPTGLTAQWNGHPTVSITGLAGGVYSLPMPDLPGGQGTLRVWHTDDPDVFAEVLVLGIGDLWGGGGQSNIDGRATNNQTYSTSRFVAATYRDGMWAPLADPTGDTGASAGSFIPRLAEKYHRIIGVPFGYVPGAVGNTLISDWQDGQTEYDNLEAQLDAAGGEIAGVLFWLGESDATIGTAQEDFFNGLGGFTGSIETKYGVRTIVSTIHNIDVDPGDLQAIWDAQLQAWDEDANTRPGPDIRAITTTPDDLHFLSDEEMEMLGNLWINSIRDSGMVLVANNIALTGGSSSFIESVMPFIFSAF